MSDQWIQIMGKNGVSGKEFAPMLIPITSIQYITINSEKYPVVMLANGEKITTNMTLNQISYKLYIGKFDHLLERHGMFNVDASEGQRFVRFEDKESK